MQNKLSCYCDVLQTEEGWTAENWSSITMLTFVLYPEKFWTAEILCDWDVAARFIEIPNLLAPFILS